MVKTVKLIAVCLLSLLLAGILLWFFRYFNEVSFSRIVSGSTLDKPEESQNTELKLAFTGDVMLARDVEDKMRMFDSSYPFLGSSEVFKDYPYVFINFEGSVPKVHQYTESNVLRFSVREKYLESLSKYGVTHASLANNHSDDFGLAGLSHTRDKIFESGVEAFGEPNRVSNFYTATRLYKDDLVISVIGLNATYPSFNLDEAVQFVKNETSDFKIVYIHWGDEYAPKHNKKQERIAKALVDAGVDLIVGHHPHVVQDVGEYKGVPIVYSLGNYIFDQYFSEEVMKGLVLGLIVNNDGIADLEFIPVTTEKSHTSPKLMDEKSTKEFIQTLQEKSEFSIK